ncbi:MAG: hypothetical protein M3Z92_14615 [Bacteroidota bacterium]|nr:hypothetical protein [Bacteroidota bacterium]
MPGLENKIEKILEEEKIDIDSIYSEKWNFKGDVIEEKLRVFFKDKPVTEIYQYETPDSEIEDLNLYIKLEEDTKAGWEVYGLDGAAYKNFAA